METNLKIFRTIIIAIWLLSGFTVNGQENQILGTDIGALQNLGFAMDVDGDYAVVGAPAPEDPNSSTFQNRSKAFVLKFDHDDKKWHVQDVLKVPINQGFVRRPKFTVGQDLAIEGDTDEVLNAGPEGFGKRVAIDGDFIVVAAPDRYTLKGNSTGTVTPHIFIYKRTGTQWDPIQSFWTRRVKSKFATDVAMDNKTIVVGDPRTSDADGVVEVYKADGDFFYHDQTLTSKDGFNNDITNFGERVDISGSLIAVNITETLAKEKNYVEIYQSSGNTFNHLQRIEGSYTNWFGYAIALSSDGSELAVSAPPFNSNNKSFAYYYKRENGVFVQKKVLKPSTNLNDTNYGHDIAVENGTVVVSANMESSNGGTVFFYKIKDSGVSEQNEDVKLNNPSAVSSAFFGYSIGFFNTKVLVGASIIDKGAVYYYDLQPPSPVNVKASAETSETSIDINWQTNPANSKTPFKVDNYLIYRNDEQDLLDAPFATSYTDDGLKPGTTHSYSVQSKNLFATSEKQLVIGKSKNNGAINGKVFAGNSETVGISNLPITTVPKNSALVLGGTIQDYACIKVDDFPQQEITVDFWIKTHDTSQSGIFSYATDKGDNTFLIADPNNLEVLLTGSNGAQARTNPTNIQINDNLWHQLMVSWASATGTITIWLDGKQVFRKTGIGTGYSIPAAGYIVFGQDQDAVGGEFVNSQPLAGQIDEVRIWNKAFTANDVLSFASRKLQETQDGLVYWWSLDGGLSGNPRGAYDNTKKNQNLAFFGNLSWAIAGPAMNQIAFSDKDGNYALKNIPYGNGSSFEVKPLITEGRDVAPLSEIVELNADNPTASVNFRDKSVTYVTGQVLFEGTNCPLSGVEVNVNGIPGTVKTDANGYFTLGGIPFGEHDLVVQYKNHTFKNIPRKLSVTGPIEDILIEDPTTFTLSGKVAGGSCDLPIGEATLNIKANLGVQTDVCYQTTIQTQDGRYEIQLPAFPMVDVFVNELTGNENSELILEGKIGYFPILQSTTLAEQDTVLNFIYRAHPELRISGFPETESCSLQVMEQGRSYNLKLEVIEDYDGVICPADQGTIEIIDVIGDMASPLEVALDSSGTVMYTLKAGLPNLIGGFTNPYQKKIEVLATTPAGTQSWVQWVVVTGSKPRSKTFTTVSPEIPLMILRDPPGDASYSYMEKETSNCVNVSYAVEESSELGLFRQVKVGTSFETGLGFSTETEIYATVGGTTTISRTNISTTETEYCLTTNNNFSTSDNENIIGASGDVFVGAALNIVYALTDVLEVNENCEVDLYQTVMYANKGLATQYFYTEEHIQNVVIPDLLNLSAIETDRTQKQKYLDQVDVWQQTLEMNRKLKAEALPHPDFTDALSFSNNVPFQHQTSATSSSTESIEFNTYMDAELAIEMGLDIAGSGFSAGVQIKTAMNIGSSNTTSRTTTNTTGFFINDDDLGDSFSFFVKRDPVYGTPVFDLIAGSTRCPVEPGTNAREGVRITLDKNLIAGIDADQAASFKMTLANTAESGGARKYLLGTAPESNPDGAVLLVNGISLKDVDPYTIDQGQSVDATLTVSRGPNAYSYENLRVGLYSQCDNNIGDEVAFSVRYESPCSQVKLFRPEAGWVVNRGSNDSLKIILEEYDTELLSDIILQYSPAGRNQWKDAFVVPASLLEDDYAIVYWKVTNNNVPDGAYDIRAKVLCPGGTNYSDIVNGFIDRQAPVAFGTPEPADGVLGMNEAISVILTESVNCNSVNQETVILKNTLTGEIIPSEITCLENEIKILPGVNLAEIENQPLQVSLVNVEDLQGNFVTDPINWNMKVSLNPVVWNRTHVSQEVLLGESDQKFSVRLRNLSQINYSFQIISLPEWLKMDETTGELSAEGDQLLNFYIDSNMEQGVYTDTIYADTSTGSAALIFQVTILCPAPDWQVEPSNFNHQMTLVAGIYANEVAFGEENDLLAAFVGNELRGMASLQKVVPQDEYVAFITIYGHTDGDSVEFRLWDASACLEKSLNERYIFQADQARGSASSFDSLTIADVHVQQISVETGWNWISFNLDLAGKSINEVLSGLVPQEGMLIESENQFSHYTPGHGWVGTLTNFEAGKMYKLKTTHSAEQKITTIGELVDVAGLELDLKKGWNWLGYLPQETQVVAEALGAYEARKNDIIKSISHFAEYSGSDWNGSLEEMNPGQGYMLKAGNGAKFKYINARRNQLVEIDDWVVNVADYEHTMNMTGLVNVSGIQVTNPNAVLGAFVGDEIRGTAQPVFVLNKWMYFITAYANQSDETFTFKLYDPDQDTLIQMANQVKFDEVIGVPAQPFSWFTSVPESRPVPVDNELPTGAGVTTSLEKDLNGQFNLNQNYPNPFQNSSVISYYLPVAAHVQLTVYNMTGQRKILVNEQQMPGMHEIMIQAGDLEAGIYYYGLTSQQVNGSYTFKQVKKMMVIK
ncbi:MAG: LamG-like jellyroll fold domain-containing protein [Candidatus Cyclobacteriaceae bacterium M3_2C_046]